MWTSTICLVHRLYTIRRLQLTFSTFQTTFISGIVVTNIIQTVFGTSVLLVASFRGGFHNDSTLCQMEGFVISASAFLFINQLTVLCVCSGRPKGSSFLRSTPALMLLCLAGGIILSALPFFGVGKYAVQRTKRFCCLNWESTNNADKMYFYILFTLEFTIPFILVVCSKITRMARKQCNGEKFVRNEKCIGIENVIWIAVVYMVMWMPYGVHVLLVLCGVHTPEYVELVVLLVALSSFAVTPFMLSRELRQVARLKGAGH